MEYNFSRDPMTQKEPLVDMSVQLADEEGKIVAGILASMYGWGCVRVDVLWVADGYRKEGLGSRLLMELEKKARQENVTLIHLDTFDFQARDFYLKNGYELFGVLKDCPKGHERYYLKKDL